MIRGNTHTKSTQLVGVEELGRIFSGSNLWTKSNELEQYHKSLYVFAAINKIASKVSTIDMSLYQIKSRKGDSKEIFIHPALDLLAKFNPFQTKTEFLKTAWINKKLTGEAFWLKVRNNRGDVVELWNLRPDHMTIVTDPVAYIKQYELQKIDGGKEIFDPADIIHFKDPDPTHPFRGMSPIAVSKTRIETEQSASMYQRDFFRNNARPDALLLTEETLDTDQRTQMTSAWDEEHRGRHNTSKIGILEGGMKYQQVSISQREMDYIESSKFTRDDILVALGVPKALITTDDVNYANAQTGMRMFLSETIQPEMAQLIEVLNEMLIAPDFGEEFYLDFKDPTPADREAERNDHTAGYSKWLTTNEIRSDLNMPAIEGGDVIAPAQSGAGNGQSGNIPPVPAAKAVYKSDEEARLRKGAKLLRGRPMLRKRFEILDIITKEVATEVKNAITKKPISGTKKGALRLKAEEAPIISYTTLFPADSDRELYYQYINKNIDEHAAGFQKEVLAQAASQEARVIAKLKKTHKSLKEKTDITTLIDVAEEVRMWSIVALPFMEQYAEQGGKSAAKLTGEVFDMTAALKKAIEARSRFFAESVTDTTFQQLTDTLTEGINAGEGIGALTKRVSAVYDNYPAWRANTIARTETTNANNEGMLSQFQQSKIVKGKEWVSTMDGRTRESHSELNTKIVGVDETFPNGARFPGDGHAKASETVNCRCVLAPALIDTKEVSTKKKIVANVKGGAGSGNFGHEGNPGHVGGSGKGGITVTGMDTANFTEEAHAHVQDAIDSLHEEGTAISAIEFKSFSARDGGINNSMMQVRNDGSKIVDVNIDVVHGDLSKLNEVLTETRRTGWLKANDIHELFVHEEAHILYPMGMTDKLSARSHDLPITKKYTEVMKKYAGVTKYDEQKWHEYQSDEFTAKLKSDVSGYATHNTNEMFAEVHANFKLGKLTGDAKTLGEDLQQFAVK